MSLVPLAPQPPRVIVMNASGKLSDTVKVSLDKPVQFYAETKFGMSYEFLAVPRKINVIDMVQSTQPNKVNMILTGDEPLSKAQLLNKLVINEFYEMIGWQQTIGDLRKFWKVELDEKDPYVMVGGSGGGAFKQALVIKKLPTEDLRPIMNERTLNETYIDGAKVFGKKRADLKLSSKQNSVAESSDDPTEFTWKFGTRKRGDMNRSYLNVSDGKNTFRAYHEMYKGYPRELSTRLSGIIGTENNFILQGEIAFNYWFEDLFGWTNYYLSRQRWGISAKTFQMLSNLKLANEKNTVSYEKPVKSTTIDLKYRLEPGLWGRDESWGFIGGYQELSYDIFSPKMAGVGMFWARSMPKVFDDIANHFPFMNYPKWVDMEFISYVTNFTQDFTVNGVKTFALNFHGQVMWTKAFFGEAGFGMKSYDVSSATKDPITHVQPHFSFLSIYGTAGIGFKF